MKNWLKKYYYQLVYRHKSVIFRSGVMLDRYNDFEGHNTIGLNTEIASSDIGLGTYVAERSVIRRAKIGRFCSIGSGVQTGIGVHPSSGFVSTHPAFYSIEKQAGFTFTAQNLFNDHVFVNDQKKTRSTNR